MKIFETIMKQIYNIRKQTVITTGDFDALLEHNIVPGALQSSLAY